MCEGGRLTAARTHVAGRVAEATLCIALLGLHFATRWRASESTPLRPRPFYSSDYQVALSLQLGHGFRGLDLENDTRLPAQAVKDFVELLRPDLPEKVLRRYDADPQLIPPPALASTRILELRLAALLWRAVGTRWDVIFAFYAGLSTLAAALVFLLARSLSGRLAAFLALLMFLASPMDTKWATTSIRDVCPAWFDLLALAALLWLTPTHWSGRRRLAGCFLAGAVSMIGYGWRTDALLMPALALVALLARMAAARTPARVLATAAGMLLAGVLATYAGIRGLGGDQALSSNIGFHIASYGSATRANLAGVENSFQSLRDDAQMTIDVSYHVGRLLIYGTPEYTLAARDTYLTTLRYSLFAWLRIYPKVLAGGLAGLADPGTLQGQNPRALERDRFAALAPAYAYLLDPLTLLTPILFLIGVLALLLRSEAWAGALLPGFAFLYGGVLLLVLPETKHTGPLIAVAAVVGGVGLASLFQWRAGRPLAFAPAHRRRAALLLAALVGAWALALSAAYVFCRHERRVYLADIRERAGSARPSAGVLGERLFSARIPPGAVPDPAGYLVRIRAGAAPALAVTHHRRGLGDEQTQRYYVNRSPLLPSREQTLFLVCLQGERVGDARTRVCTVRVEGDAHILSAQEVDLAGWGRPVFSTVFTEDDAWAGNPRLPPGIVATEYRGIPGADVDDLGLRPDEAREAGAPSLNTAVEASPTKAAHESTPP